MFFSFSTFYLFFFSYSSLTCLEAKTGLGGSTCCSLVELILELFLLRDVSIFLKVGDKKFYAVFWVNPLLMVVSLLCRLD